MDTFNATPASAHGRSTHLVGSTNMGGKMLRQIPNVPSWKPLWKWKRGTRQAAEVGPRENYRVEEDVGR